MTIVTLLHVHGSSAQSHAAPTMFELGSSCDPRIVVTKPLKKKKQVDVFQQLVVTISTGRIGVKNLVRYSNLNLHLPTLTNRIKHNAIFELIHTSLVKVVETMMWGKFDYLSDVCLVRQENRSSIIFCATFSSLAAPSVKLLENDQTGLWPNAISVDLQDKKSYSRTPASVTIVTSDHLLSKTVLSCTDNCVQQLVCE